MKKTAREEGGVEFRGKVYKVGELTEWGRVYADGTIVPDSIMEVLRKCKREDAEKEGRAAAEPVVEEVAPLPANGPNVLNMHYIGTPTDAWPQVKLEIEADHGPLIDLSKPAMNAPLPTAPVDPVIQADRERKKSLRSRLAKARQTAEVPKLAEADAGPVAATLPVMPKFVDGAPDTRLSEEEEIERLVEAAEAAGFEAQPEKEWLGTKLPLDTEGRYAVPFYRQGEKWWDSDGEALPDTLVAKILRGLQQRTMWLKEK